MKTSKQPEERIKSVLEWTLNLHTNSDTTIGYYVALEYPTSKYLIRAHTCLV